jgi:hypothetical protein
MGRISNKSPTVLTLNFENRPHLRLIVLFFNSKLVLPSRKIQFEKFLAAFNSKSKSGEIIIPYEAFPDFTRLCPSLDQTNPWFMGFSEAEGSFSISISSKSNSFNVSFSIGQKGLDNKVILDNFISLFGVGSVSKYSSKDYFEFRVTGLINMRKNYPYFENHAFLGTKGGSYLRFRQLILLLEQKAHLDPAKRPHLLALSKQINPKLKK